jgi:hypothetical protein
MFVRILVILLTIALLGTAAYGSERRTSVTVYNQDLGLVREVRPMKLLRGVNTATFTDVAAAIDPTSVHLRSLKHPDNINVLEQNYHYDLISPQKLLEKYLGKMIRATAQGGKLAEGSLLSFSDQDLTLMLPDSSVGMVRYERIEDLSLPKLPEGLVTRPTLVWLLDAEQSREEEIEVSYLTEQISWHAEYVGVLATDEKTLDFAGWVSIDNRSGATYKDANVKLVAGTIHRAEEGREMRVSYATAGKAIAEPQFEERAFFEYHLYTLGRKTTIHDRETKQISLFPNAVVKGEKMYAFEGQGGRWRGGENQKVKVRLKFKNRKEDGLGISLPKGKIRIYKRDRDGSAEFIGEDRIDHTPKDERVMLNIGDAFDVVGERKVTDRRRITDRVEEEKVEITLRNHKEEDVMVTVIEYLYGDWEIREKTMPYRKIDANTIEFDLPIPHGGEARIRYTVRRTS